MKTYQESAAEKTGNLPVVRRLIEEGFSAADAINMTCRDVNSYNEAMKEHGLKPVVPD